VGGPEKGVTACDVCRRAVVELVDDSLSVRSSDLVEEGRVTERVCLLERLRRHDQLDHRLGNRRVIGDPSDRPRADRALRARLSRRPGDDDEIVRTEDREGTV
jgi:hypothetical protein